MPTPVNPYSEYGVALRTLRSSRSWLGYGLFLCLMIQILGFSLMWYTQQPYMGMQARYEQPQKINLEALRDRWRRFFLPSTQPSTQAELHATTDDIEDDIGFPGTKQGKKLNIHKQWDLTYSIAVPVTQILGLMAVCSQVIVMFLTLLLILIAQAPGVVHVTRGLIWSILLLFMVFPWQYIARSFPVPGVLYGYVEMLNLIGPHVVNPPPEQIYGYQKLLVYARFIIWPTVSMVVLLIVAERFRAGIMLAIGHPLQSMMQPRAGATPKIPNPLASKPN